MRRFLLLAIAATLIAALADGARAQQHPAAGDPQEGHRLALKICSFCHVAASDQPFPPTLRNPGPSFQAIADRPSTTAVWLRNFLLTTHTTIAEPATMPNPDLADDQVTNIVAYLLSLRSSASPAK